MTDRERPRLLTRGFWAMMALATASFLAAAGVMLVFGSHHLTARPEFPIRAAPLAEGARDAKTAPPQPSFGPP